MKHKITVSFTIDTDDYADQLRNPKDVWDLVGTMLDGDVDLPPVAAVQVDDSASVNWRRGKGG